jgi:hypothetical protein
MARRYHQLTKSKGGSPSASPSAPAVVVTFAAATHSAYTESWASHEVSVGEVACAASRSHPHATTWQTTSRRSR